MADTRTLRAKGDAWAYINFMRSLLAGRRSTLRRDGVLDPVLRLGDVRKIVGVVKAFLMTDRPPTGDGFDVARARAETPGCAGVLHFNNAGAALMPVSVLDAQMEHLLLEAATGGYEAAAAAEEKFSNTYDAIARLLGCAAREVALMENATVAWNMAFHALKFAPGDRILTSEAEYASNYIAYLQVARRTGAVVEAVPSDNTGQLDLAALDSMIDRRVKLISLTHVPTNGGLVNPAAEVGRLARAAAIPYLLDACQSAGQIVLDVDAIGCDMLAATGRKYLRGPRGTGFLYVREDFLKRLEPPFLDLRAATWETPESYVMRPDARRFENWEFNHAAIIGLGVAVDYALTWGIEAIERRVTALAEELRRRLAAIPGVALHDLGARRCGIVTFTVEDVSPDDVRDALAKQKMNVLVSRAASTLLDMTRRGLAEVVRASVHYYNTSGEIERFCAAVEALRDEGDGG